ncbi:hypothetical protein [Saccharothrix luteola]|uniref:hypothetical protein n=1 Tax=Saccharothrix luteola TaxID=2893018 RepID=UPI001E282686|nr:hypothetical protein [Saccharothrix luteola]MCC8245497.1 hypothetical protein [Saccharothrix luteola]
MAVSPSLLLDELKALCRGRGVEAPGLDAHLGPALREVCGVEDEDGAEVVREKLSVWARDLAGGLPEDLQLAVVVPLGLHPDARYPFLARRVEWLADRENRDPRTIRRRVGHGLTRLVEAASHPRVVERAG